jgi:hypothetical protein
MSRTVQRINVTTGEEEIITVSDADMGWIPTTTEENNAFKLNNLRVERNAKLAETDWEIVMHKEKGTNIPTALKTYRQALRDITDTYTSLDDVVWPEKP